MTTAKMISKIAACLAVASTAYAQAFEGAVGFGAVSTGGNGGETVRVTNLDDSGAGSLRDAVSRPNRNVVFDVSGYITLKSALSLSDHITINGQTAPRSGVGVKGNEVSASGRTDIIIRNFRFRQGTLDSDKGNSAFNGGRGSNIILDHCSLEFGRWDTVDVVKTTNLTVSNSIIALPITQQFGAHVEGGPSTFYRNLWVSAHNRQPLAKDNSQFINNVVYNYEAGYTTGNTGGHFSHDIINNYFIAGPNTHNPSDAYFQVDGTQSVYASGNYIDGNKNGRLDGYSDNSVDHATPARGPWDRSSQGLASLSASDAYSEVVGNAGAQPRDELDTYVVNTVKSLGKQGFLITDQSSVPVGCGGYGCL